MGVLKNFQKNKPEGRKPIIIFISILVFLFLAGQIMTGGNEEVTQIGESGTIATGNLQEDEAEPESIDSENKPKGEKITNSLSDTQSGIGVEIAGNAASMNERVTGFVEAKVTKHVDGDTVHVTLNSGEVLKVRMIGIDTPEIVHPSKPLEFYGKEASDFTKNTIYGKTVYLEKDVSDTDKYGRALRYIWTEIPDEINKESVKNLMINGILVAKGYANASTYPPDVKYQDYFLEFQRESRGRNIGLWDPNKLNEFEAKNNTTVVGSTNNTGSSSNQSSSTNSSVNQIQEDSKPVAAAYIGNARSAVFHKASCSSVRQMAEHNKVKLSSRNEAINKGYRPCKNCNP